VLLPFNVMAYQAYLGGIGPYETAGGELSFLTDLPLDAYVYGVTRLDYLFQSFCVEREAGSHDQLYDVVLNTFTVFGGLP